MKFENTKVFNIEGAMRGMRFPFKGVGDSSGENIGPEDMHLARRLWSASERENLAHSKYLRQILVSVDITAPLYFWSEMDTYKIGTTANSESTMHTLIRDSKDLSVDNFKLTETGRQFIDRQVIPHLKEIAADETISRKEKIVRLKEILPTSFKQRRHWTANYKVIRNIYKQRCRHTLSEWNEDFTSWVKTLPYTDYLILGKGLTNVSN